MRKLVLSAALASAFALSAPAAAQDWGRHPGGQQNYGQSRQAEREIGRDLGRLEDRIFRAIDRRQVSRREGERLLREHERIADRFDRFRYDGLSRWEYQELSGRIDALRQRLRFERWDDRRDPWEEERRWDDRRPDERRR
ncbi:MAG: hypothetical protein ACK4K7_11120 [Allosphingosinicella sp.]|uniref:hypothetical protein n=1 Tax=Allosphingosinicella sp. TaxID=2823234 RepID=UPI003952524F